jgi:hypothetical protein
MARAMVSIDILQFLSINDRSLHFRGRALF